MIPSDSVTSIAATVRLVATPSLLNFAAGVLTRIVLATKAKVASNIPGAGQITAPDSDLSTMVLPVHPGTLAYMNGTQPDILDQAQNVLYLGSIILALLGSIGAWVVGVWNKRKLKELQAKLGRLSPLLSDISSWGSDRSNRERTRPDIGVDDGEIVGDEIHSDDFRKMKDKVSHIQTVIGKKRGGQPVAAES